MNRTILISVFMLIPVLSGFDFATFHTDQPALLPVSTDVSIDVAIYKGSDLAQSGTIAGCLWLSNGWTAYPGSYQFHDGATNLTGATFLDVDLDDAMNTKVPISGGGWICLNTGLNRKWAPDAFGFMKFELTAPPASAITQVSYTFATPSHIRSAADQEIARHKTFVGYDSIPGSDNGSRFYNDWELMWPAPNRQLDLRGITYGDGHYVMVGRTQDVPAVDAALVYQTSDFNGWNGGVFESAPGLTAVAHGGGRFVAVSRQNPVVVSEGAPAWAWTVHDSQIQFTSGGYGLRTITYGDGEFIAAGDEGTVAWSSNGESWGYTQLGLHFLKSSAYGNGTYIIGGHLAAKAVILTSPNGRDWAQTTIDDSPGSSVRGLAYGNGVFVGCGPGTAYWSSNGIDWHPVNLPSTDTTFSVAFGDGFFAIAGESNQIFISPDGVDWDLKQPGTGLPTLNGITYGDDRFVAVGDDNVIVASGEASSGSGGGGCNTVALRKEGALWWGILAITLIGLALAMRRRRRGTEK